MIEDSLFDMIEQTFSKDRLDQLKFDLERPAIYGVRLNPYKVIQIDDIEGELSLLNENVFIPKEYKPMVHHPYHHAGAYYIQDPSSSLPVEYLDLKPNDVVLDMCAAPGGKSSQILSSIPNGFLIANEIDSKRNKKLQTNLGRWGVENYVVTQEDGRSLSLKLNNCFDKILLDAPCSGEGLIRRKKDYTFSYDEKRVQAFANLQQELLESAYQLAKNQATIVYSTCTLNAIENEDVLKQFLTLHPECKLEPIEHPFKEPGLNGFHQAARFFPSQHGEGQFMAKIKIYKNESSQELHFKPGKEEKRLIEAIEFEACFEERNQKLYGLKTRGFLDEPLAITQDGTEIASIKKNRFDFHHNVSQSLYFQTNFPIHNCTHSQAYHYLNGQTVASELKGYCVMSYKGLVLGLGKGNGKHINNRYPKQLRNRFLNYSL
ncbi:methyltransferase RsmF C-terminal domain-like protein [Erysipelothrix urinaevulpis]|uniref:methyltransferase RsmF C-terminal domain-like protein n=1 Tax=Erysipelothrix urinaevulpis TaxID=2683717 RepID=UPI001358F6AF|nr:hypothetical protein [Erysipelothrix urinaevulpis]